MRMRATKWIGGDKSEGVGVQESAIAAHVIVRLRSPDEGTCLSEAEAEAFIAEIRKALGRNKRRLLKKEAKP